MFIKNLLILAVFSLVAIAESKEKVVGIVINKTTQDDITTQSNQKHPYGKYGYYHVRDHYAKVIQNLCEDIHVIFLEPNIKSVKTYSKIIDGLLIPGLTPDIDPALYNEKKIMNLTIDKHLSKFEIALLKEFKITKKPTLGICHGAQIMNVAFGGNLYQDIAKQKSESKINHNPFKDGNAVVHEITIAKDAKYLFDIKNSRYAVNSVHHQAVKKLATEFSKIASTDDGVIEAIQIKSHPFFVGVQWHPEFQLSKYDENLIKSFCSAVHGNNLKQKKAHIKVKLL